MGTLGRNAGYGSLCSGYYLNGSQIVGETWTVEELDEYGEIKEIQYFLVYVYDETGSPVAVKYRTSENRSYD